MDALGEDLGVLHGPNVHSLPEGEAVHVAKKARDPEQWGGHG
jgi:hypothetical protein